MSNLDPDSVVAVARKDFQDAVRSYLFLGLSVFFFTILVVPAVLIWYFAGDLPGTEATTENLIMRVHFFTALLIPVIGLVLGWKSIAGERADGSIKVMLSMPHSRTDVLVGKFLGRSAVLTLSLLLGFMLAAGVVAALLGAFDVVDYIGLFAVSVVFGVVYTSLAVSISSLTESTSIAGAAVFGVFVWFYLLWDSLVVAVAMLVMFGYLPERESIAQLALFYDNLNPGSAYANVLSLVTAFGEPSEQELAALEAVFDGVPFYLEDWFALVVLLAWIVVPLALAAYRFERIDL